MIKYKTHIALILFWISFDGFAQIASIEFNVEKDTVLQGEIYKNEVSVKTVSGDSLIKFRAGLYGMLETARLNEGQPPLGGNSVLIKFAAIHNDRFYSKIVFENEYDLVFHVKTLNVDTTFNMTKKYYVMPSPAYKQWLSDPSLKEALLFPETPAQLANNNSVKEEVSKAFLRDQKRGILAFSFVVNPNGTSSKLVIHQNTFSTVTKEKLEGYIYKMKWVPAKDQEQYVQSIQGVHIVR